MDILLIKRKLKMDDLQDVNEYEKKLIHDYKWRPIIALSIIVLVVAGLVSLVVNL